MEQSKNQEEEKGELRKKTPKSGMRVFVAGGARSGNDEDFLDEAYKLGQEIAKVDFRLDFGLASSGIMGAVAKGVFDYCKENDFKQDYSKKCLSPVQGITTKEYLTLYQRGNMLFNFDNIVVAKTLEERKKRLLRSDFIVFAPGGVGTLDELAYDCVAMQDGFLPMKPFVLFNVNGYFHHLVEYLKSIQAKEFSDRIPFIVVDNSKEAALAFQMLKYLYFQRKLEPKEVYPFIRGMIYEFPYVLQEKTKDPKKKARSILRKMLKIKEEGSLEEKRVLRRAIEEAYLSKEIERMYQRLSLAGTDVSIVSQKLEKLKNRRKTIKS
ncbi:MAG: hypothetical protein EOM53_03370 [Alphaproteobacteria bacterium]|nr:hypothetical protein [Alphaproteobacteria bacterium]